MHGIGSHFIAQQKTKITDRNELLYRLERQSYEVENMRMERKGNMTCNSYKISSCYRAWTFGAMRSCAADVLNPSCRIAATRSAFCSGFASEAANRLLASFMSVPL